MTRISAPIQTSSQPPAAASRVGLAAPASRSRTRSRGSADLDREAAVERAQLLGHHLGGVRVAPPAAGASSQPLQALAAEPRPPGGHLAPAGRGKSMPAAVRARMERALGQDFSDVRIHEGGAAESIGALAFTRGRDIHFAPGKYSPVTRHGQEILGHELAHVAQQQAGRVAVPQGKGAPINADPALEAEADQLGRKAARQPSAAGARAAGTVVPEAAAPGPAGTGAASPGADSSPPIQRWRSRFTSAYGAWQKSSVGKAWSNPWVRRGRMGLGLAGLVGGYFAGRSAIRGPMADQNDPIRPAMPARFLGNMIGRYHGVHNAMAQARGQGDQEVALLQQRAATPPLTTNIRTPPKLSEED